MSRLSKGLVGQGNLSAIEKHSEEILTHNGKKDIVVIPLYQICSRYENMYINSTENNKRLRNSIEKIGLITPIAVIPIDKYKPKDIVISNYPIDTKCDSFKIVEDDKKIVLRR